MVERQAHVAHALGDAGVILIGVHVPHEVGRHGHEAAAALAQAAGQEEQLAQRFGIVDVVVVVMPFLADVLRPDKWGRVIACDNLRVLSGQVKRIGHTAQNDSKRLVLLAIQARVCGGVERHAGLIQPAQQRASVFKESERQFELHILLKGSPATGNERRAGGTERTGRRKVAEVRIWGLRRGIDGAREKRGVRRHAGRGTVEPSHMGIN